MDYCLGEDRQDVDLDACQVPKAQPALLERKPLVLQELAPRELGLALVHFLPLVTWQPQRALHH
jgi:hypothetical protein